MTHTVRHHPHLFPVLFLAGALLLGSCAITLEVDPQTAPAAPVAAGAGGVSATSTPAPTAPPAPTLRPSLGPSVAPSPTVCALARVGGRVCAAGTTVTISSCCPEWLARANANTQGYFEFAALTAGTFTVSDGRHSQVVTLAACESAVTVNLCPPAAPTPAPPAPTEVPAPPAWTTRWLQGSPCWAPCWEGVTPGLTTVEEAVAIWSQNPLLEHVQVVDSDVPPPHSWIQWDWQPDLPGVAAHPAGGGAAIAQEGGSIVKIYPDYPGLLAFRDVQAVYGAPSHVLAGKWLGSANPYYSLWLVYLPQGLVLPVHAASSGEAPRLSAGMAVEAPMFFEASTAGLVRAFGLSAANRLLPWQGYEDFYFYCRTDDGGLCGQ
jgi:hypothetical protein